MTESAVIAGQIESEFPVRKKGTGKPDYTGELWGGLVRSALKLRPNQTKVTFAYVATDRVAHPYSRTYIKPLLGPYAEAHMIDIATGLATPYSVPAGYSLTLFQKSWNSIGDFKVYIYMDDLLTAFPIISSGLTALMEMVSPYSTVALDPTSSSSHTVDVVLVNPSPFPLECAVDFDCILEEVGTPPLPEAKTCKCPFCGAVTAAPAQETHITCSQCGKLYFVAPMSVR